MKLFAILKRLDVKNLLKVIGIGLSKPLFILPTIRATKDCLAISSKYFGKLHHKHGPANAFRHALWNYLIAKRCFAWSRNEESATQWAKRVTDWHEDSFPNKKLPKQMDLHNNEVGRFIYRQNADKVETEVVAKLKEMTGESIKINETSKLSNYKYQMVHIL